MKNNLFIAMVMVSISLFSQNKNFWKKITLSKKAIKKSVIDKNLPTNNIFSLDINALRETLKKAPSRGVKGRSSHLVLSFPDEKGKLEDYRIFEASVLHPELAAKYPEAKSYAGVNIADSGDRIRFSVSPTGMQSMRLGVDKTTVFIEPYSEQEQTYAVFDRADRPRSIGGLNCTTDPSTQTKNKKTGNVNRNANDNVLRTYRIAISATGEYTNYHGSKREALWSINNTMTRVNAIYETDFNVTMIVVPGTERVIYTDASDDPYSTGRLNGQLQATLTSIIGESNYDIGHLFHKARKNGNAGCIGCVCVDGQKGSAFSSHQKPEGEEFDVDFVAHEIGHQFGGNHTWTFGGNERTNVQMEPGSGSTIIGYAGITGDTDVQKNSDPYFHAATIEQITNYVKSTSCQTEKNTGNSVPRVEAGPNYTIPKGTPFVLTGNASDANSRDILSYCWEQFDEDNAATIRPNKNSRTGVAFRSFPPTRKAFRYFPDLEQVNRGAIAGVWESLSYVSREYKFRLTVRDNREGGGANNSDDMRVTVNASAGPFKITSQNTKATYTSGSEQIVTWNVAGTTNNGINAKSVDILLSNDNGRTYEHTLAKNVPNDGSHSVVIPVIAIGRLNKIMVKGSNHIFFDVSNESFDVVEGDDTGKPKGGCASLDFNEYEINSFSNQDKDGDFFLQSNGSSISLRNNTWKYINYPYTITPNTVIEFEFSSTSEGEVHGIGFEDDDRLTPNKYFKVFGNQNYGVTNFNNYVRGTKTFLIPVGDSYTGKINKIVFINDNDKGLGNNSTFSNVKVYEKSCQESKLKAIVTFGNRVDILGDENEESTSLIEIAPSPVKKGGYITVLSRTNQDLTNTPYKIFDLSGRFITKGILNEKVSKNNRIYLKNIGGGAYLIHFKNDFIDTSKRFIIE